MPSKGGFLLSKFTLNWLGHSSIPMLTGVDLITFVKESDGMNQMELARGAGYLRTTKTGREQVLVKRFYNSLLAAKGMPIPVGRTPGKSAQFVTTVHKSGVVLLGKTYIDKFGLKPGDGLQIDVQEEFIQLAPLPVAPETINSTTLRKVAA
jgi:bifunctional DNA-binding transcriptional regulator/antitoxin component of YhaV-PrlF toxin-antitoxin module